jgi:serine/threonine protein kinase/Tol biopolymer transport system component
VTLPREAWPRLKEAFEGARALAADARPAYLAEVCHGDEALRHEVELLLAHNDQAASFLETPAVLSDDSLAAKSLEGRCIGPYQVSALIGTGGMGEVYRAHDKKLARDVAIKVLPPMFTADRERVARFDSEARMLAALNHPHIGAIYGLEEAGGMPALVLELVDGETLADRLRRGPVPTGDTLAIARQIADALDAAHRKRITHRDLKPANIKVTPDGLVKVLDFGLAKALASDVTATLGLSQSPTAAIDATRVGVILGTAAYMSPEQARGLPVDTRADIWAFGCVLYEMLTGRPPFSGQNVAETLAAILEREPDWKALPSSTPARIRELLRHCLQRDPALRVQNIADARDVLDQAQRGWNPWHIAAIAAAVVATLAAALFPLMKPAVPVTSPSEYTQLTNFTDSATAPSLSPDGRMVVFKRGEDSFLSNGDIYVKLLPNGEAVKLTTEPARRYGPVFTPDGSRIAYTQVTAGSWDTWTVPVPGGQPTRFLPNASGLTWIADHRVLFSEIKTGFHMGIVTATEGRAESREIYIQPDEHAMAHYSYLSPDRQSVLVVEMIGTHAFTDRCRLVPFDGRSSGRQVGPQGTCIAAAWAPDGQWMYFSAVVGGSAHIWRQKFPDGAPEQITFGATEEEGIALAADGRSFVTSVGTRRSAIWIHDAAGERAILSEGYALVPRLSRDGTRVFYLLVRDWWLSARGRVAASAELRSLDPKSGKSESVLSGVSIRDYEISRDEKEVAFTTTDGNGTSGIWLAALDRRTPTRQIAQGGDQVSFGPEEDLVFRSVAENNALIRIRKDGTGRSRVTAATVMEKFGLSPDGKWVIALLAGGGTFAVPVDGGAPTRICARVCPSTWSSDGRWLYVGAPVATGKTYAIPVPSGRSLPNLPAEGIDVGAAFGLPGARIIENSFISPGTDPSTYVFTKTDLQRNLFRIPLH